MIPGTTNRWNRDAALIAITALPAAAAANASASIDFGSAPGRLVDDFDVLVELPAPPSLADAKTITLTLKDSPDNVTFTAIPSLAPIVVTGAGGIGGAPVSQRLKLPDYVNQYLRLDQAVQAAGGDNTAISSTLSILT